MMRRIFMFVMVAVAMCSCNPKQTEGIASKIHTQVNLSTINEYKDWKGFRHYCDSLEIPYDLELWQSSAYRDYETKKVVTEYFYLKVDDVFKLKMEINQNDTTYSVIHRITE